MSHPRPSKMKDARPASSKYLSFEIESISDEYPILSWYISHLSDCTEKEMVAEETGHRIVWGLVSNDKPVTVTTKEGVCIRGSARKEGSPLGLAQRAYLLRILNITFTSTNKTNTMDAFLNEAKEAYDAFFRKEDGIAVFYTRKFYEMVDWKFYGNVPYRPISSVHLDNNKGTELLSDVKRFTQSYQKYQDYGRPYKRVYCLHGPPGTGKTSVVMAVASEMRRSLAIFNADSLRDDTFIELLSDAPKNSILLFEDVDSLFRPSKGRDQSNNKDGMTFSTMLNSLDGVLSPPGAIVFLTTNHLEDLGEAMQRPGRVDRLVHIPNATPAQAEQMWRKVFPVISPPRSLIKASSEGKISPAFLSEFLFRKGEELEQLKQQKKQQTNRSDRETEQILKDAFNTELQMMNRFHV